MVMIICQYTPHVYGNGTCNSLKRKSVSLSRSMNRWGTNYSFNFHFYFVQSKTCITRPSVSKQNKKCSPNEIQRNLSDTKANPWSINVHFYDQQFNMVMSGYLYCFHYVTQKTRSPGLWQDPRINSNILITSLYVIRSPRSSRLSSSKLWVWQCPAALVLQYIMKVYLMNP